MQKLLLLLLFLGGISCKNVTAQSNVIEAGEFEKMLQSDKTAQLVDVRTAAEFNSGHIESAVNYDFYADDFDQKLAKLDKNKTVMVYCAAGGRSASSAEKLKKMGFKKVYDLDGGMGAWRKAGKKVVTNSGQ